MKKGMAVETVLYAIILVIAVVVLTLLVRKMVPAFGDLISASMKGICNSLPGFIKWMAGC
jgi:hypothetical protein